MISSRMPWDFWLIVLALGVLVPWRGRERLRTLLALEESTPRDRIRLYLGTIAFQWMAVGVVLWRSAARGLGPGDLGLSADPAGTIAVASVTGALAIGILQWLNLKRISRIPEAEGVRARLEPMARRVLPQSRPELLPYLLLAVTAGVCEEILYRGFLIAALERAAFPVWAAVLASAALFGLAHLYQGRGGIIGTLLLGTVFSVVRIAYHSLVPVMVWHVTFDTVAGIAGPRYLVRRKDAINLVQSNS